MRTKHVVLLSNRSLLTAGVHKLLQNVGSLELSIVPSDDPAWFARVKQLAPRVVLFDGGDSSMGPGVVAQMLAENLRVKLISLRLDSGDIDVYRRSRVEKTSLDGLLKVIEGRGPGHKKRRASYARNRQARNEVSL